MKLKKEDILAEFHTFPVLPLKDVVVFPHMVVPLFVGRKSSVLALEEGVAIGDQILLLTQIDPDIEDPEPRDLYSVGTVANILQFLKLADGTVKVLIEGRMALATHTCIISPVQSTTPHGMASARTRCSSTTPYGIRRFGVVF